MREALASRDYTAMFKIYRNVTGLTQEAIALLLDKDQGTVSKIYNGNRSRYTVEDVEAFRDGMRIPGHLLGLQPGPHELAGRLSAPPAVERGDLTNRREFNQAMLVTALGLTGPVRDAFIVAEPPGQVGKEHVHALETAIRRLEKQDSLVGGSHLCDAASWLHDRAYGWLHQSSYSIEVGEALQSAVGELGAWAGWLAIDADRHPLARHHFQETLLLARMNDDHPLEVRVLSYMCLQSLRQARPREAVQMAKHAQRIAAGWANPRLLTLLHLRAARAHAAMDNEPGFLRELAIAKSQFAAGARPDDPLFINFVTEAELAGITALSYLDLHRPDWATDYLRRIIADPDPVFRRNTSYYTVKLAEARLNAGDLTEACEIGANVVQVVSTLDSGRVRRRLHELRDTVAPHGAVARDFVEAYDATFAGEGR